MTIVEIIQAMLVPGILISGCGLLLLATNNKYSLVINRIRILNEEKRKLFNLSTRKVSEKLNQKRLKSISIQGEMLSKRLKYVRNTVIFYHLAVAFFIFTCIAIGLQLMVGVSGMAVVIVSLLIVGIFLMLEAVYFGIREAWLGYQVMQVEMVEE